MVRLGRSSAKPPMTMHLDRGLLHRARWASVGILKTPTRSITSDAFISDHDEKMKWGNRCPTQLTTTLLFICRRAIAHRAAVQFRRHSEQTTPVDMPERFDMPAVPAVGQWS